jgi:hypothetical protein
LFLIKKKNLNYEKTLNETLDDFKDNKLMILCADKQ